MVLRKLDQFYFLTYNECMKSPEMYKSHPNVHIFNEILIEFQTQTCVKLKGPGKLGFNHGQKKYPNLKFGTHILFAVINDLLKETGLARHCVEIDGLEIL